MDRIFEGCDEDGVVVRSEEGAEREVVDEKLKWQVYLDDGSPQLLILMGMLFWKHELSPFSIFEH